MTTTAKSISPVLASVFLMLDTSLAAWNWYLRPERVVAWSAALTLLGSMAGILYLASRRSRNEEADRGVPRALADAVVLAGLILAISLSERLAATLGVDRDFSYRAVMVMVGAFLAFTGNTIPKTLTPLSALRCDPARAQACQRFTGWTWAVTGLAFAMAWLALPEVLAASVSMLLIVSAVSATLVLIIRLRRLPPNGGVTSLPAPVTRD